MINYSEMIVGFSHVFDSDRFGWSPHGLLKDSLGTYCKNYVSPLASQFSQDENMNKEHELVLLRDGERQLKALFSEEFESSGYKKIAVHQDFENLVPSSWADKTLLYTYATQRGFFFKNHKPKELILVVHSNQLVCNKTSFSREMSQLLETRSGEIQSLNKVRVLFFNSRMVDEVNPLSFVIEVMDQIREQISCPIELAEANDIFYGPKVDGSYFHIFNSKEIVSDPFLFHHLISRGCVNFLEFEEPGPNDIEIPLSIYHSIVLKNLNKNREIQSLNADLELKKWREFLQIFTVE